MGGFDEHLRGAVAFGIIGSVVVGYLAFRQGYGSEQIGLLAVTALGLAVVAGTAPDIDVHSSIPREYLGKGLVACSGIASVWILANRPDIPRRIGYRLLETSGLTGIPPWAAGGLVVFICLFAVARSVGYGIDELTTHRGLLHSFGFAVLVGVLVVVGLRRYGLDSSIVALSLGAVATGASLVHTHVIDS